MRRYVLGRLLALLPLFLIMPAVLLLAVAIIPGDPAITILGENATPASVAEVNKRLGLDAPIYLQYVRWLWNLLHFDLGVSLFSSQTVIDSIAVRLPVTFSITLGALLVAVIVGIPVGIVAAIKQGSTADRTIVLLTSAGVAIPGYLLATLLVYGLALRANIFPATGYVSLSDSFVGWLSSIVMPSVALGAHSAAEIARQLRASMINVLQQDYIRTARAMGLRDRTVIGKYALRNAAIPMITVIGFQVTSLLGGAVIIETVFGLPGIGDLAVNKVFQQDIPVIQGIVVLSVLIVVITNLLVDLTYVWLNPKVNL